MKFRFPIILLILLLTETSPLYAQLSLGNNPQPATPQAAQMTRYGNHNANLYTGRVTVSIPIGEYRDKDFTVPVSLEYNSNGMRPNEQAPEAGLGWTLLCGGMITREVVGCADEGESDVKSYELYSRSNPTITVDIHPFDNMPFDSLAAHGTLYSRLLTSEDKPGDALTAAYKIGGRYYDATSDVYHFRMPGHSGSFFRNDDGSFTVFDAGGSAGTYRIEKESTPRTGKGYLSQITVTTGDGYRYVFGSLQDDDAFLERRWLGKESGSDRGTIVAWRLREVVSPGGRTLQFSYYDAENNRAVQGFQADRWVFGLSESYLYDLAGSASFTTYAPLGSINAGDGTVIEFHYSEKDEEQSGTYLNGTGIHALNPAFATYLLDSITVNDVTTSLSYVWNSLGNPYPFLTEVHTEGTGSWQMSYEGLADGYFPPFWTAATDHWGYLNTTDRSVSDRHVVNWASVSQMGSDYAETEAVTSSKLPDTVAVRMGLLSSVRYPTGGSTRFTYAANRYGKVVDKRIDAGYLPQDLTESGIGPGLRITRIENRDTDGTVTDARTFSYGTGRLLAPFRHKIHYAGTLTSAVSTTTVNIYYATTGGILRQGTVLLEYPAVTEKRLDGSRTIHAFTSWDERNDLLTDSYSRLARVVQDPDTHENLIGVVAGISDLAYVNRILEPRSSLQHFRGLPLSTLEYAAGGASPLKAVRTAYDLQEPGFREEFMNVGEACAAVRRYGGEAHAQTQATSTYYGQDSVSTKTSYAYNGLGQVTDERTGASDGDSLRTVRTWPQDYPSDPTLTAMAAANFVGYPVMEVQLRKRSGSSAWDTTAAVRYTYAPYSNSLDSTSFAMTAIHRRQDDGSWLTEGTFLYDNKGNIIQQTDADSISTSYIWNSVYGVSIVVENATREQVEICLALSPAVDITNTVAAAARLRSGLSDARVSDFEYFRYGQPWRMTDPAGRTVLYDYDDNGRLVSVREDGAGILQQYHYNTSSR